MKSRGLSEEAAYALLRKTAMNQNRKIAEIAQSLVTAAGLLGPGGRSMSRACHTRSPPASCRCSTAPCWSPRSEKGFAAREGVELTLVRETSWANIRDRLAVGHFDVAHMLAPMPIACNLGLTPLASRTIAPMALGLGGNAITVSNAVWAAMAGARRRRRSRSGTRGRGA